MNSLGLIFDIIGVLILFTMDLKMIGLDADAIPMTKDPVKVKKEKIKACIGLGFILFGFTFQFLSNFICK
ncbi:MAG TPA: hypothetical protein PLR13_10900 [Smithella sp.]|nr:hypothetical protein [Smithella sp.]HQM43902.1 hypothetical protein [Smithellaceae bacterium]